MYRIVFFFLLAKNPPYFPKIMERLPKLVIFCGNNKTCINSQRQKLYTTFSNNSPIKVELRNKSTFLRPTKENFLKKGKIKTVIISYLGNNDNKITVIQRMAKAERNSYL